MTRDDIRRFATNVPLVLGLAGALVLAAVALFGSQLASADPNAQHIVIFFPGGRFLIPPTPPDQYYPLGTDPLGRDQLSRVLYGARLTFTVVLLALAMRASLAIALGLIAGWRSGIVDRVVLLVTNAVSGIPQLLLALLIAVWLRDQAILGFVVALGLVGWAEGAQFVRGEVRRIRSQPYVEAARALGGRTSGLLRRHVLRGLGPQLFGLLSLEAGSTLLLLAELGFLGVFMSGGAFLVDAQNRPILPARDRAPEWGQMLAGAQQYAFHDQYVAFVPGVVVGLAVFVFNLLGEGVRGATDPFSMLSLSPRALGALGRGTLAVALVSAAFFGISEARATTLSFDDALHLAEASIAKVEPGAPLVAAVVSLRSDAHALERPAKYNFYFRSNGPTPYWRVGFPDADQNATETKRDVEDGIPLDTLPSLDTTRPVEWHVALGVAETEGGAQYRASLRTWLIRVVLARDPATGDVYYRTMYTSGSAVAPTIDSFVDAATGAPASARLRDATMRQRAQDALGGPIALVSANMFWRNAGDPNGGFGAALPFQVTYGFVRADLPDDRRVVTVFFAQSSQSQPFVSTPQQRPGVIDVPVDLQAAFDRVEESGGSSVRAGKGWSASAFIQRQSGRVVVLVSYQLFPSTTATFVYDPATGEVTRTQ
ncbi:MAG TPA: ABC transporter permease [Candidatus Limnocylindria bacterium]